MDAYVLLLLILEAALGLILLHRAGLFVQYQQPGAVPPLQRRLGDQLLGQIKIKI